LSGLRLGLLDLLLGLLEALRLLSELGVAGVLCEVME
jgi:hypothetical protein